MTREVWFDTRGSRDARKPTPYCHHFLPLMPDGPGWHQAIGCLRMLRKSSGGRDPDLSRGRHVGLWTV